MAERRAEVKRSEEPEDFDDDDLDHARLPPAEARDTLVDLEGEARPKKQTAAPRTATTAASGTPSKHQKPTLAPRKAAWMNMAAFGRRLRT